MRESSPARGPAGQGDRGVGSNRHPCCRSATANAPPVSRCGRPDSAPKRSPADDASRRQSKRALAARAAQLAQPLLERHPVLGDVFRRSRPPLWASLILLAAAFATGFVLSALDGSKRINVLAPPVLGLVLWNLLVYLGLAIGAATRLRKPAPGPVPSTRSPWRWVGRRLGPLLAKTAEVDTLLGAAVRRFAVDWSEAAAPLLGQHVRRWLHLGAAADHRRASLPGSTCAVLSCATKPAGRAPFSNRRRSRRSSICSSGAPPPGPASRCRRRVEQVAKLRWDGVGRRS